MAVFQTIALQNNIYEWSREHRIHHDYSETNADPYNAKRGFFFAHFGWLMCKKHPDFKEKENTIDMSDLDSNPVVRFQRKFYIPLALLLWGVFPTAIPYYFWKESLTCSIFICVLFRCTWTLNLTLLSNSAAHLWGTRVIMVFLKLGISINIL